VRTKGNKVKRALVLALGGFAAGTAAIGAAWMWLAITEEKLYGNLYHFDF
jgi:hypothetical protein